MPSVLRLRLLFRPDVAYRVYDFFRPSQVARVPDGSFLVTAEFPDTPWVDGFLLSFGAQVAVLEPEAVRRRVESAARRMLELYGAPSAASSIK